MVTSNGFLLSNVLMGDGHFLLILHQLSITTNLKVGNTIEHQRFGIGEVLALEGSGENAKATVAFRNAGQKQLLLKFAKFKVIG